jgi:anaerobic selenocysteine-containing dehydrogenase
MIQQAKALGGTVAASFPWKNYETALKERVKGLVAAGRGRVADEPGIEPWRGGQGQALAPNYSSFGQLWRKLREHGCWVDSVQAMPSWDAAFTTPSGKFEFSCQKLRQYGIEGTAITYLPHFEEVEPAGDPETYPLLLVPYNTMLITSGPRANTPFMTKLLFDFELKGNHCFAEINPRTAAEVKLNEGDRVTLETEGGAVEVKVHLTEAARPGVVFIPVGLGHRAFDAYIKGKGVNASEILVARQDRVTGLASWWGTRVKISKIHEVAHA